MDCCSALITTINSDNIESARYEDIFYISHIRPFIDLLVGLRTFSNTKTDRSAGK